MGISQVAVATNKDRRFEEVACPLCHASEAEMFRSVPALDRISGVSHYSVVRCRRCDLVYLNPRPTEAMSSRFYGAEDYLPFVSSKEKPASTTERLYAGLRRWNLRWKRRQIEKLRPQQGRILDVGCGTGEFLLEMRRHGWEVKGVERDHAAVQYAMQHHALPVYAGSLEALPRLGGAFDVITLWHVLEHLYHPHRTLQALRDLLRPDGLLVIAVPNIESVDSFVYRADWVALDAPRHVQHFRLRTLKKLCGMHQLQLVSCRHLPLDSLFNAWMSERRIMQLRNENRFRVPLRAIRAAAVATTALLFGAMGVRKGRFRGSTLLTFWRRDS